MQQQQVLQRRDAFFAHRFLAEPQKAAQLVTEIRVGNGNDHAFI